MTTLNDRLADDLKAALVSIYGEIMWLAARPNVTAWYTQVMAESVKRRIRQFTGQVSASAVSGDGTGSRLEHYRQTQTTLTELVEWHRREQRNDPGEFVRTLFEYESVHIVTPVERQQTLWQSMLRQKVANAESCMAISVPV